MTWDDHEYCERCRLHLPSCWCYSSRGPLEEGDDPDTICPGGDGHGLVGEGIAPWPPAEA